MATQNGETSLATFCTCIGHLPMKGCLGTYGVFFLWRVNICPSKCIPEMGISSHSVTPEILKPLWVCFWARAVLLSRSTYYSSPSVKVQHFQSSEFELHSPFPKNKYKNKNNCQISSPSSPVYSLRGFLLVQTLSHNLSSSLSPFSSYARGSLSSTAKKLFSLPIPSQASHTCHVFFSNHANTSSNIQIYFLAFQIT